MLIYVRQHASCDPVLWLSYQSGVLYGHLHDRVEEALCFLTGMLEVLPRGVEWAHPELPKHVMQVVPVWVREELRSTPLPLDLVTNN